MYQSNTFLSETKCYKTVGVIFYTISGIYIAAVGVNIIEKKISEYVKARIP
jgi:hypothetical protein